MNKTSKIYVAGHLGLVGSAIWKNLESKGYTHLIGKSLQELDLMDSVRVEEFFETEKPEDKDKQPGDAKGNPLIVGPPQAQPFFPGKLGGVWLFVVFGALHHSVGVVFVLCIQVRG